MLWLREAAWLVVCLVGCLVGCERLGGCGTSVGEGTARGGRLLVVTRCAPCSAAAPVCCHSRKLASLKQCARWQQLSSPR